MKKLIINNKAQAVFLNSSFKINATPNKNSKVLNAIERNRDKEEAQLILKAIK